MAVLRLAVLLRWWLVVLLWRWLIVLLRWWVGGLLVVGRILAVRRWTAIALRVAVAAGGLAAVFGGLLLLLVLVAELEVLELVGELLEERHLVR